MNKNEARIVKLMSELFAGEPFIPLAVRGHIENLKVLLNITDVDDEVIYAELVRRSGKPDNGFINVVLV